MMDAACIVRYSRWADPSKMAANVNGAHHRVLQIVSSVMQAVHQHLL